MAVECVGNVLNNLGYDKTQELLTHTLPDLLSAYLKNLLILN